MKFFMLFLLGIHLSCFSKNEPKRTNLNDKTSKSKHQNSDLYLENYSISKEIETFIDSVKIGHSTKCKIELIKNTISDVNYVTINFYYKSSNNWNKKNTFTYQTNAVVGFDPQIKDFNNDHLNDISFISGSAARGGNVVRRLFIYDKAKSELKSILNSEDFPNLEYNKELDCIDSYILHGTSTTLFTNIYNDSLKIFASVYNDLDYHIIYIVDSNGNEKELYRVKHDYEFVRFKKFKPLIEYFEE